MGTPIMIMAGGTGGHVFPGLAVADYLRRHNKDVVWLGTREGIEARIVPAAGIELETINIKGLRGRGLLSWLLLPFRLVTAMFQSLRILLRRKPAVVLAMGGFASGPGALVAWFLRRPLIIHEQNAVPGLTNRFLAFFADQVLCGFPAAFKSLPGVRHVGNPVRDEILAITPLKKKRNGSSRRLHVLVLGGSQGARVFNEVLPQALSLIPVESCPEVLHQSGQRWHKQTLEAYGRQTCPVTVSVFFDDMKTVYEWADLVICRAGAMTIAELAAVGLAAILVPYPYAVDDHQTANARFLSERDAAVLIAEKELTPSKLKELLLEFSANQAILNKMAINARSCAMPNATEAIATYCMEAAHA